MSLCLNVYVVVVVCELMSSLMKMLDRWWVMVFLLSIRVVVICVLF